MTSAFTPSPILSTTFTARKPLSTQTRPHPSKPHNATPRMVLEVGQRVRVATALTMYHYPAKFNIPVEVLGKEGTVVADISVRDGVSMTPISPYLVKFDENPKFKAHFEETELEVI